MNKLSNSATPAAAGPATAAPSGRRRRTAFLAVAGVVGIALLTGAIPRALSQRALHEQTAALALPTVSVIKPALASPDMELVLPGDVQAFQQTPIFARTNGYLKKWYADIGTRVKQGQLLAEIEAPELDDQLRQARAELKQAQADHQLAQVTATRWQELLASNSVSRQETDMKASDERVKQALLESARSNVSRLEQLESYTSLYAPFDGVITARNVDTGALIDAGSAGGPARELFDLARTDRLRTYVDVPQDYSRQATAAAQAYLTLSQYPDRKFPGDIVRNAESINPVTRTLRVEIDLDNADAALLPGAYAQAHLGLHSDKPGLSLPVNTLLFRPEGVQVAVVDAQDRVSLKTITIARDFGSRVEVATGLSGDESVILNPTDAIAAGSSVRIAQAKP